MGKVTKSYRVKSSEPDRDTYGGMVVGLRKDSEERSVLDDVTLTAYDQDYWKLIVGSNVTITLELPEDEPA
jgi:hypothetical protein